MCGGSLLFATATRQVNIAQTHLSAFRSPRARPGIEPDYERLLMTPGCRCEPIQLLRTQPRFHPPPDPYWIDLQHRIPGGSTRCIHEPIKSVEIAVEASQRGDHVLPGVWRWLLAVSDNKPTLPIGQKALDFKTADLAE